MGKGAKRVTKNNKKHDTDESDEDNNKNSDNDASSSIANTSVGTKSGLFLFVLINSSSLQ